MLITKKKSIHQSLKNVLRSLLWRWNSGCLLKMNLYHFIYSPLKIKKNKIKKKNYVKLLSFLYWLQQWFEYIKKQTLWRLFKNGVRLQSHYEKAVYVLQVPRNSWYSFDRLRKDVRLSWPWSHPVVFTRDPWIGNPAP